MFVCMECGHIFDDEEVDIWEDPIGEFWGVPCSVTTSGCPLCSGDYTKTYKCDCCGEYIVGDYIKTSNGKRFCENCYCGYELGEEY